MAYIVNEWLEKFEIKKPDYDLIEREYVGMEGVKYTPVRYVKKGDMWKSKKTISNLFGKKKIRLMFIGDITCFEKQFEEAKNGKEYDFRYEFDKVKPIFSQADLVVGNLETMIFPYAPYRTEKYVSEQNFHCNAPIEFLDAIRNANVDVLTNANNHDLDTGAIGIGETIDRIEKFGFIQTGTFKTDKKRYELIDVEGFKIAIVAFATEHNNKHVNLTKEGRDFLLNDYSKTKAKEIIDQARNEGAEVVFTCIHWGKENKIVENEEQRRIAKELVELGYDAIIGSHPHVLQPFKMLNVNQKIVPTFYSMGNFLSHNIDNQKARSIIACFDLQRKGDAIHISCSYIPIFTSKNCGDKKYVVVPIHPNASNSGNVNKIEKIRKIIGNEIDMNHEIQFSETIEKKKGKIEKKKACSLKITEKTEFPLTYDDGKFCYKIYENHALVEKLSVESTASSYTMPEVVADIPIIEITPGAFEDNQVMKKINFRKNIKVISERAFKNCSNLEGFQLGSNVLEIQEEAFANCTKLSAAIMKDSVKRIGNKAFYNCTELRSVKMPEGVLEIAEDAFEGCSKAVFYCEKNSYAEQYAKENGIQVINMNFK